MNIGISLNESNAQGDSDLAKAISGCDVVEVLLRDDSSLPENVKCGISPFPGKPIRLHLNSRLDDEHSLAASAGNLADTIAYLKDYPIAAMIVHPPCADTPLDGFKGYLNLLRSLLPSSVRIELENGSPYMSPDTKTNHGYEHLAGISDLSDYVSMDVAADGIVLDVGKLAESIQMQGSDIKSSISDTVQGYRGNVSAYHLCEKRLQKKVNGSSPLETCVLREQGVIGTLGLVKALNPDADVIVETNQHPSGLYECVLAVKDAVGR